MRKPRKLPTVGLDPIPVSEATSTVCGDSQLLRESLRRSERKIINPIKCRLMPFRDIAALPRCAKSTQYANVHNVVWSRIHTTIVKHRLKVRIPHKINSIRYKIAAGGIRVVHTRNRIVVRGLVPFIETRQKIFR